MSFFSEYRKRLAREDLQKKLDSIADVDVKLEDLDVAMDLDSMFDALSDTFDELGDTFDDISGSTYLSGDNEYTGSGAAERAKASAERVRILAGAKAERVKAKAERKITLARAKAERTKAKAQRQQDRVTRQQSSSGSNNIMIGHGGGNSNISVSGNESISISGTNGNLTMKIGNMRENKFKHKLKLTDNNTATTTHIRYFDENNFVMTNDEFSGSINDATIKNVKHSIHADIHKHNAAKRPPPPEPQMPPNESFKEHELYTPYIPIKSEQPSRDMIWEEIEFQDAMEEFSEPLFRVRTWTGNRGKPIKFDEGARVTVSGHNSFGRKYEVKINETAIFVPTVEELMVFCYERNHIEAFVELSSTAEKAILLKIIDGLIATEIAEPHHIKIKELL